MDILLFILFLFNVSAATALIVLRVEKMDRAQAERAKASRAPVRKVDRAYFR